MSGIIKENPCYVLFKKKNRFVWRYPSKNWHDSVAFHIIVKLVMLCLFMSRVCWLPKRGPTWPQKSCFYCALMLKYGHRHHAAHPHHMYTQVTRVDIDSFGKVLTPIILPSEVKKTINRTRFLNHFPLALRKNTDWDSVIAKFQYIMNPYVATRTHNNRMVSNLTDAMRNTKKICG